MCIYIYIYIYICFELTIYCKSYMVAGVNFYGQPVTCGRGMYIGHGRIMLPMLYQNLVSKLFYVAREPCNLAHILAQKLVLQ